MATVTYDNRSLLLDGRRIWLVSGAIHYFRTPAALWRDRLLKARRGGLNCIETYVAWNVHEPREGQWDFSGDHDVVEFIRQAGDLGMYVIVRPGPYICSEWDFGGLPAWLAAKSGLQVRSANAAFTHYYGKYFRQILPRLAELQVTRGGNVIAIQNENEYFMTTMPDRQEYLGFITQMFRRAGFDVPILTCNGCSEPMVEDAIECYNGWDGHVANLRRLKNLQPEAPLISTEFWIGNFDWWTSEHHTHPARETARRALEMLGAGAQTNYYMYHGGTNFGFWGGRSVPTDAAYMTTSYDYDAPIAEGGGLTDKYYALRLVNVMASRFGEVLGATLPLDSGVPAAGSATLSVAGARGRVTVVTNNGDETITRVPVVLHDGRTLEADLSHFGAVALFSETALTDRHTLDYCNLMPLGIFREKVLVLHGPPGQAGVLSLNGKEIRLTVPKTQTLELHEAQGLSLLVMPSVLAERCWSVDDHLFIGPDFVGETVDEIVPHPGRRQHWVVNLEGKVSLRKVSGPATARTPAVPRMTAFRHLASAPEPMGEALEWQRLDRPRDLAALGVEYGYGWYQTRLEFPRPIRKYLYLPQGGDRLTLWLNGKRVGTWGRGDGASRDPISVQMAKGTNTLTLLADNLGRFCFGFELGEHKGLWGDVYSALPVKPRTWKVRPGTEKDFARRLVPRSQLYILNELKQQGFSVCETSVRLGSPVPVHLQFAGLGRRTVAVLCNDRLAGFFPAVNGGFGEAMLTSEVQAGSNTLRLLVWGDEAPSKTALNGVKLFRLEEDLTGGRKWGFRPLSLPAMPVEVPPGAPAWFEASFPAPPDDAPPLFVRIDGARKGQIYLNGHNVGRFWTVGPQELYYLPAGWLEETNTLTILDEQGLSPEGSKLEFRPQGPFGP